MNCHYAFHYSPPGVPVIVRFTSAADRDAYVADLPHCRRPRPAPADTSGFKGDHLRLAGGVTLPGAFRVATIDDMVPAPLREMLPDPPAEIHLPGVPAERPATPEEIEEGFRYLEEVRHCRPSMPGVMAWTDARLRDTRPADWTKRDVVLLRIIHAFINPPMP